MKRYKLTDENMCTHAGYKWKLGEWRTVAGKGTELCSNGYFHVYQDPFLALFLNPIHADFTEPRVFLCETRGKGKHDGQLKSGYKTMRLLRELEIPRPTPEQCVRFGIFCAEAVYKEPGFQGWVGQWLSGVDRSHTAADAAADAAAYAAAHTAADAAAYAAAHAQRAGLDLIPLAHKAMEAEE